MFNFNDNKPILYLNIKSDIKSIDLISPDVNIVEYYKGNKGFLIITDKFLLIRSDKDEVTTIPLSKIIKIQFLDKEQQMIIYTSVVYSQSEIIGFNNSEIFKEIIPILGKYLN